LVERSRETPGRWPERGRTIMLRLVNEAGEFVTWGDEVVSFRGERAIITSVEEPHKPASTGRVYVRWVEDGRTASFYPGVFNLHWEGRTDRS
jgi:hypothetical protein